MEHWSHTDWADYVEDRQHWEQVWDSRLIYAAWVAAWAFACLIYVKGWA